MKSQIQQILFQNISKDAHPVLASETVKAQLIPIINHLMDTSFMNFVQTLYELDIDENKIIDITNNAAMNAADIADLIIERENKKIETRRLWKQDIQDKEDELLL
jgi:predicted HAD superfamily Cof-like phosphohydrolase